MLLNQLWIWLCSHGTTQMIKLHKAIHMCACVCTCTRAHAHTHTCTGVPVKLEKSEFLLDCTRVSFLVLIVHYGYTRCYHLGGWVKTSWELPCTFYCGEMNVHKIKFSIEIIFIWTVCRLHSLGLECSSKSTVLKALSPVAER